MILSALWAPESGVVVLEIVRSAGGRADKCGGEEEDMILRTREPKRRRSHRHALFLLSLSSPFPVPFPSHHHWK